MEEEARSHGTGKHMCSPLTGTAGGRRHGVLSNGRHGSDDAIRLRAAQVQELSRRRFRQRIAHAQCLNGRRCETTTYSQSVGRQQAAVGPERLTTTTFGLHAPSTEICYSGLITYWVPVTSGD